MPQSLEKQRMHTAKNEFSNETLPKIASVRHLRGIEEGGAISLFSKGKITSQNLLHAQKYMYEIN